MLITRDGEGSPAVDLPSTRICTKSNFPETCPHMFSDTFSDTFSDIFSSYFTPWMLVCDLSESQV